MSINKHILNRFNVDYGMLGIVADEVVKNLRHPFGSFEKATYLIYRYNGDVLYYFTKTCHNTEYAIEIMKEYYKKLYSLPKSFKIWKRVNGIQRIVYEY